MNSIMSCIGYLFHEIIFEKVFAAWMKKYYRVATCRPTDVQALRGHNWKYIAIGHSVLLP